MTDVSHSYGRSGLRYAGVPLSRVRLNRPNCDNQCLKLSGSSILYFLYDAGMMRNNCWETHRGVFWVALISCALKYYGYQKVGHNSTLFAIKMVISYGFLIAQLNSPASTVE